MDINWIELLSTIGPICAVTCGCMVYFRRETKAEIAVVRGDIKSFEERIYSQNRAFEERIYSQNRAFEERIYAENQAFQEKMHAQNQAFYDRIQADSKDFHGRLCEIEARNALFYEVILKAK